MGYKQQHLLSKAIHMPLEYPIPVKNQSVLQVGSGVFRLRNRCLRSQLNETLNRGTQRHGSVTSE